MALPKIQHTLFDITIPSSGKKVKFRPFLVREEKILLTAEQSGDVNELLTAIKQVITNCCTIKIDADDIPLFDIEYIFLKLRSRSVSNISEIVITDRTDNKKYNFNINLDEIEITKSEGHSNKIDLGDGVGIVMKYPSMHLTDEILKLTDSEEKIDLDFFITKRCVYQIYDVSKLYTPGKDCTDEELEEFLLNLNKEQSKKIKEFFETTPKLIHTINYVNSLGEDKEVVFEGINDFFQ